MIRIRKFIKKPSNWPVVGIVLVTCLAMVIGMAPIVLAAGQYDIRNAGAVNVTTAEGTAIFEEYTLEGSTGTGTFQPFLQVNKIGGHAQSPVYGFSTDLPLTGGDAYPFCNCTKGKDKVCTPGGGVFYTTEPTYQCFLTELPHEEVGGINYIEFMLDSNQDKGGEDQYLTWDQLKIYQTNIEEITYTDLKGLTPVWDLDSAGDSWILFDAQFGSGSGQGDMRILIPSDLFVPGIKYVVVWVSFGGNPNSGDDICDDGSVSAYPNNDGFEEFGYIAKPLGCLEITKVIDWDDLIGDPANVPDVDFTVNVEGPSYPAPGLNLTFHLVGGLLEYDDTGVVGDNATACLCDLTPGEYYVTEPDMPPGWGEPDIANDSPAVVASDTECGIDAVEVIVTNIPPSADVSVEKTGNITYTIVVHNDGPSDAANVTVNDPLPGLLEWQIVDKDPDLGTWGITGTGSEQRILTGTIDSLACNASVTVIVAAAIDGHSGAPLVGNNVTVSTTTLEDDINNNIDWADIFPIPF
jgi:uncharacterized repeat protein (TIGR01451 family)